MIVTSLVVIGTFLFLYYVPGRLLVERFLPEPRPEETFAFSLGLGFILVNTTVVLVVGVLGLLSDWLLVKPWVLWAAGLLWTVALAALRARTVRPLWRGLLRRPTRAQVGVWALSVVGFVFFLGHYDHDLLKEDGCNVSLSSSMNVGRLGAHLLPAIHEGAAAHVKSAEVEAQIEENDFLSGRDGQVLGPSFLLSPFTSLFGRFGLRVTYAVQGLLLPGIGFVLGLALFRRGWAAWATALLLTFHPWAIEARTFNENFLANVFGSLALALALRGRVAPVLAGLAMGLFLAIRHLELVAVPFMAWWIWHQEGRRLRPVGRYLLAMVAALSPCVIYHVMFVVTQDGTLLEPSFDRPLAPHSFLGLEFRMHGLLNFPFIPEPMRSPFQAYPNTVAYLLDIVSHLGWVLVALLPAGVAALWSWSRRGTVLVLAWFVPLLGMVMIQSNWINPNKMGYHATAAVTLVLLVVGGAAYFADRGRAWWKKAALAAVGVLVPVLLVVGLRDYRAPLDQRVIDYPEGFITEEWEPELALCAAETEEYLALDRARYDVSFLPDTRVDHGWDPALVARDWRYLLDDLANPGFDHYQLAMPDFAREVFWGFGVGISPLRSQRSGQREPDMESLADTSCVAPDALDGETAIAWLDLSRSPLTAEQPLTIEPDTGATAPLLARGGAIDVVAGFRDAGMPDHGTTLLVSRDRLGTVYLILAPGEPNAFRRPSWVKTVDRRAEEFPGARVPVRVPRDGVIRIVELRSYYPVLWYSRFVILDEGQPRFTTALPLSPS